VGDEEPWPGCRQEIQMKLKIEIDVGNCAFEDDDSELKYVLMDIADKVPWKSEGQGNILDSNGNHVGSWTVTY
jgi:hypothetical protein